MHSRRWYEVLVDFLAFLVDELWKKWQNMNMGNPLKALGNSCHIWNIFGITFEPETLEP